MTEDFCTCKSEQHEEHRCPYSDDVYDEYKLPDGGVKMCDCCPYCTHQCAMDI